MRRYDGPTHDFDQASSVAVGPDGARVFVTGYSTGIDSGTDLATTAYAG